MKFPISAKKGYKGKHESKNLFRRYTGRKIKAKNVCAFIVFVLGFIFAVGGVGAIERETAPLVLGCVIAMCGTALMALVMIWTHGGDDDRYED